MIPIEQQLRDLLEDNGIESDVAEKFIEDFQKSRTDDEVPDVSVPELEMMLLNTSEADWRRRAVLAARIISKNYDKGY